LNRDWPNAAENAGLMMGQGADAEIPILNELEFTEFGLTARINTMNVGVPIETVARNSVKIATSIEDCRFVQVVPSEIPSVGSLHFRWADPLAQTVPLARLPLAPTGKVAFGLTESGTPATVSLGKSLLVVGMSGAGKSSTVWALIASLIAGQVPFRLWVLDPKGGAEFSVLKGSPLVHEYCDDPGKPAEQMIARLSTLMLGRLAAIDGTARVHVPTPEAPYEILILDELLALDNVLANNRMNPLRRILNEGRAAGVSVWASTQVPQQDTVGTLRRMFVQKLVLRTESPAMTGVVLGQDAEGLGARCSNISDETPGMGYAHLEFGAGYERFRSVWVPDADTITIAQGVLPPEVETRDEFMADKWSARLEEQEHILYEWRYAPAGNALIYAGISNDGLRRATEHLDSKKRKHLARKGVTMSIAESFPTRSQALEYEANLIGLERPPLNTVHNPDPDHVKERKLKEIFDHG
jgi:S-DNA-T family DNA segregation ATPase FtsK/SpoIIIE